MAVLCEAISVVIRLEALEAPYGTFEAFKNDVPNDTLAVDGEIVRVGFMNPDDLRSFVSRLEARGLSYVVDGKARDFVVIDQQSGPVVRCEWVEFGQISLDGNRIAAARLTGSGSHQVLTPDGWVYEGSLSQTSNFVPNAATGKALRFLRSDRGIDVYLNPLTGKEMYVGRTGDS